MYRIYMVELLSLKSSCPGKQCILLILLFRFYQEHFLEVSLLFFQKCLFWEKGNIYLGAGDLIQWTGKILGEITESFLEHKGYSLIWARRNEKESHSRQWRTACRKLSEDRRRGLILPICSPFPVHLITLCQFP